MEEKRRRKDSRLCLCSLSPYQESPILPALEDLALVNLLSVPGCIKGACLTDLCASFTDHKGKRNTRSIPASSDVDIISTVQLKKMHQQISLYEFGGSEDVVRSIQ